MQRIAIIGRGGAGKSTLARELGDRLSLPVIHLDTEHWLPGWVEPPAAAWKARVAELVLGECWIIDGNFGGTMETRFAAADTIVFLDFPGWLCAWRVLRRVQQYHGRSRPDLPEGCPEKLDLQFLKWIRDYGRTRRPAILGELFALAHSGKRVVILGSPRAVQRFRDGCRALAARPPEPLRRIAIIGPAGAGKSSLASRLDAGSGLSATSIDALSAPGGSLPDPRTAALREAVLRPEWLVEGLYWRAFAITAERAQGVIHLDLPLRTSLPVVIRRRWRGGEGRFHAIKPWRLRWLLRYPLIERPMVLRQLRKLPPFAPLFRLRSRQDIDAFAAAVSAALPAHHEPSTMDTEAAR